MSDMLREEIEILSDSDSNDDIENSKDECFFNDDLEEEAFEILNDKMEVAADLDASDEDDDDIPLNIRLAKVDGIWESKRKSHFNPPFTEHCGPKNLPENIMKPGEIFLCLFSDENLCRIVHSVSQK